MTSMHERAVALATAAAEVAERAARRLNDQAEEPTAVEEARVALALAAAAEALECVSGGGPRAGIFRLGGRP